MNSKNVQSCMRRFKGEIPKSKEGELRKNLENLSDDNAPYLLNLEIKSSRRTVFLSSVLGFLGAGSFYLGRIRRGLIKVLCFLLLPVLIGAFFLGWLAPKYNTYYESGINYLEFSEYTAPQQLNYFEPLEYIRPALAVGEVPDKEKVETNIILSHVNFTSDINSAYNLYSTALADLNFYFNEMSYPIAKMNGLVKTEELKTNIESANSDYGKVGVDVYDYLEGPLSDAYIKLIDWLTFGTCKSFGPGYVKAAEMIFDNVNAYISDSLKDERVSEDEELVNTINALSAAVKNLQSDFKGIYDCLNNLSFLYNDGVKKDFGNIIKELDLTSLENTRENLTELSEDIDNGEIESSIYGVKQILNEERGNCARIDETIEEVDTINKIFAELNTVAAHADDLKTLIFDPKDDEESFADLLENALNGLTEKTTAAQDGENESEETPDYAGNACSLLNEIKKYFSSTDVENSVKLLFSENDAGDMENRAETIADSIEQTESTHAELLNLFTDFIEADKTFQEYSEDMEYICNSGAFTACASLVCGHADETLLRYYLGFEVDYAAESGESLLYYCMANPDGVDPLNVNEKLKSYYANSKDIIIKYYNNRTGTLSELKAIEDDLAAMKTTVNDLNALAAVKTESWSSTADIITMFFTIVLVIGVIIIIAYWIGEVYDDRKYCLKINYQKITKGLIDKYKFNGTPET